MWENKPIRWLPRNTLRKILVQLDSFLAIFKITFDFFNRCIQTFNLKTLENTVLLSSLSSSDLKVLTVFLTDVRDINGFCNIFVLWKQ